MQFVSEMAFLEQIGMRTPVVQAGMGGGLSRHELAAAVAEAGGLGTIAVSGDRARAARRPRADRRAARRKRPAALRQA
jgi:NAD(P)H-dependent flavin oxidoreductase YrpB (nitropropane dioxygenase family)